MSKSHFKEIAFKLAAALLSFCLGLAFLEGAARIKFHFRPEPLLTQPTFSATLRDRLHAFTNLNATGRLATNDRGASSEIIHPYLGFVIDPHKFERISEWGFSGPSPLMKRSSRNYVVGLMGGSVSQYLYRDSASTIVRELAKSPNLKGKNIILLCLASAGYKQPQQLMTLAYFLSVGAAFDAIINLDGFNEVALAGIENLPQHVHPIYPRAWFFRTRHLIVPSLMVSFAKLAILDEVRLGWARRFDQLGAARSLAAVWLWNLGDRAIGRWRAARESEILTQDTGNAAGMDPYMVTGPPYRYPGDAEFVGDLADIWMRCSTQMRNLCEGNGIRYYHFLQPNQYVPGSKQLTDEERRSAYDPKSPRRKYIELGYPAMRARSHQLKARGVQFTDLSRIFALHPETLYSDTCCHMNPDGEDIVAREMAKVIRDDLEH